MNQTPSRGQGRYNARTPSKTPNMKGLFADGLWQCNCTPRLPADHFQTKNGGPNHGRWFYTCQKPQPKRCGFFLWDNDAKAREARAVLANSHTEPLPITEPNSANKMTPTKNPVLSTSPITPYSNLKPGQPSRGAVPAQTSASPAKRDDDWLYVSDNDYDDDELRQLVEETGVPPPETSSKVVKQNPTASPGKRTHEDFQERSAGRPVYGKPTNDIELFNTPNEIRSRGLFSGIQSGPQTRGTDRIGGLISPGVTPAINRFEQLDSSEKIPVLRDESPTARKSNIIPYPHLNVEPQTPSKLVEKEPQMTPLAKQILDALHSEEVEITEYLKKTVMAISQRHTLEFTKMEKGRDVCREKIKKQDSRIHELEAQIKQLKMQSSKR